MSGEIVPGDHFADVRKVTLTTGERVPWFRSPLDSEPGTEIYPTRLRPADGTVRGIVVDPAEVERIRARFVYAGMPWWRRWLTRAPEGWRL